MIIPKIRPNFAPIQNKLMIFLPVFKAAVWPVNYVQCCVANSI